MRGLVVIGVLVATAATANASPGDLGNWLIGPVLGVRIGHSSVGRAVFGVEGGGGYGPERFNLGFEHREDHDFGYAEIDPWYLLGGTIGVGMDDAGKVSPVLGVWEGIPLNDPPNSCDNWHSELTIAGGYRYTGVHELYITVKAGRMHGNVCFN